jgi:hypothetical protein
MQLVKRRYDPEEFLACMFKKEGGGSRFLWNIIISKLPYVLSHTFQNNVISFIYINL